MANKKMTAMQLAKLAGVSHATVSRAFSPNGTVSEKTRENILQLANIHGYRPNSIAASLNRSRSRLVAIVASAIGNLYEAEQLDLLTFELQTMGLMPLLLNCNRHTDSKALMQLASSYQVDYTIVFADLISNEDVKKIFGASRLILVRNRPETASDHTTIIIDPRNAIAEAVNTLVAVGRRQFLFLHGRETSSMDKKRKAYFDDALLNHGLRFTQEAFGDYRYNSGFQEAMLFLKRSPEIDTVIVSNDAMALGVLDAAAMLGVKVPDDIAVIGHDGVEMAFWNAYNLSTIALNHQEYVNAIISRIRAFEADDNATIEQITVKAHFRRGKTI